MRGRRSATVAVVLTLVLTCTGATAVVVAVDRSSRSVAAPAALGQPAVTPSPAPAPDPTSASPAPSPTSPTSTPLTITVNGDRLPLPRHRTVAAVLGVAGLAAQPGRFLSVVRHRKLRTNGQRGGVSVDGHRATLRTTVQPGDRIVVHDGRSRIEPVEKVVVRVPPAVPSALYVGSRAGLAREVRGTISHEVVSRHVLRRPRIGHLVEPGAVALTFDDGPSRRWTRAIADLLHRHHTPATFCMIGRQVREYAGLVRRIARDGNALCDHTWDHDLDLRARRPAQQRLDIDRGFRAIRRATGGVAPTFFRAPGGYWSRALTREARARGMRPLPWTVDPDDWTRPGVRHILHAVMAELRPGGVILLHDGGGNRRETLAALRTLLRRLPKLGYHFVLPPA